MPVGRGGVRIDAQVFDPPAGWVCSIVISVDSQLRRGDLGREPTSLQYGLLIARSYSAVNRLYAYVSCQLLTTNDSKASIISPTTIFFKFVVSGCGTNTGGPIQISEWSNFISERPLARPLRSLMASHSLSLAHWPTAMRIVNSKQDQSHITRAIVLFFPYPPERAGWPGGQERIEHHASRYVSHWRLSGSTRKLAVHRNQHVSPFSPCSLVAPRWGGRASGTCWGCGKQPFPSTNALCSEQHFCG